MNTKYDISIDNNIIIKNLDRITNQIFKLLPSREEGGEWETTLNNLIIEICGMVNLFPEQVNFLRLLSKLEGLKTLTGKDDFLLFRTTIFECLSLTNNIKKCLD